MKEKVNSATAMHQCDDHRMWMFVVLRLETEHEIFETFSYLGFCQKGKWQFENLQKMKLVERFGMKKAIGGKWPKKTRGMSTSEE